MAFPVIENWQSSTGGSSDVSSLTCVAPSGITSGEILVIAVGSDSGLATTLSINTGTYPGWVKLGQSGTATEDAYCAIFAKASGGSEGNVVVDNSFSGNMQAVYYRISGHDITTIATDIKHAGAVDTSSPYTINGVGSLSASLDYLSIAALSFDGGDGGTFTVGGTGFSKTTQVTAGTGLANGMGVYAEAEFSGATTSDACTFSSGVTDGSALYRIEIKGVASTPVTVSVTGVGATGSSGSVTTDAEASVTVTGVSATGSVGVVDVAIREDVIVNILFWPLELTGEVGDVTVSASAVVPVVSPGATGYGEGTYGSGVYGGLGGGAQGQVGIVSVDLPSPKIVAVTGLEAAGQVGNVSVTGIGNISVTGLAATGQVGQADVVNPFTVPIVTGLGAVGWVGEVTAYGTAPVSVAGLSVTGEVDSVSVTTQQTIAVTGIEATGQVGEVTALTGQFVNVPVTGIGATGQVGSVSVATEISIDVTGLQAIGRVGQVLGPTAETVVVTGLSAIASVGLVTVPEWNCITPNDEADWSCSAPDQTPDWSNGSISN